MVNGEEAMAVELVVVNRRAVDATWLGDWRDQCCSGLDTSTDLQHNLDDKWMAQLSFGIAIYLN